MIVSETMCCQHEPHPADPGYEPESATLPEAGSKPGRDLICIAIIQIEFQLDALTCGQCLSALEEIEILVLLPFGRLVGLGGNAVVLGPGGEADEFVALEPQEIVKEGLAETAAEQR
jgi:hypothetical protein